jgi:ribosomal protein S18 acetylase RimI-like enzyme
LFVRDRLRKTKIRKDTTMKILPLPPKDAARLVPLLQDLHVLHVQHQPARYPANPKDQILADWLQDWLSRESLTALIAESPQGALLGYVIYGVETRPHEPLRSGETRCMIHHIAVTKAFRRMGVGLALLHEVKRQAKCQNVDSIATSYAPFNTASAGLFQSLGLQPVLTTAEWRA